VIDVVGLTASLLGDHTPDLSALRRCGGLLHLDGVLPAVTCPAQASLLTGLGPEHHGVVANGWLHRDTGEVRFWNQSRRLVQAEMVYDSARRVARSQGRPFTCAKLFFWFNQGADVDFSVTPKPHYGCDGAKAFDVLIEPAELDRRVRRELGPFPFASFWGPLAGLRSSDWISRCAELVLTEVRPHLTLVYLPHLDYDLQRYGPSDPRTRDRATEVDGCAGRVIEAARRSGATPVVLSEYGITDVSRAVLPNRRLRESGWLSVRKGPFGEHIDVFGSRAFAVVDHQLAHVYVREAKDQPAVRSLLEGVEGVGRVLEGAERRQAGLDHPRAGELVLLAREDSWFAYPYWLEDSEAPDFARTVDIHRKPGYDPCELLFDPARRFPRLHVARRLLGKKLGFRNRLDVIPLDPALIRGSHGLVTRGQESPVLLSEAPSSFGASPLPMTAVRSGLLGLLGLAEGE
jgi:predicted AlkP superfamily pyrophosphatase or phosphodiesterase